MINCTFENSDDSGKMSIFNNFIVLCVLLSLVEAKNELYSGNKVYNVKFDNQEQQNRMDELKNDIIEFIRIPSFRKSITGRAIVPVSQMDWFEERLNTVGIEKDIYIEDLHEYLREKDTPMDKNSNRNFDFSGYYRYEVILQYLLSLQNATDLIEIIEHGETDEGNRLVYVKVARNSNETVEKPVIIVEAGINPSEWITIPAAINVINRLIDSNQTMYLDNYDWIIVPVANPDGYEYTHTDLRLWSKNLSIKSNLGFICPGVNINRNFDIDWQRSGSSSTACSHLYAGIEPFSEVESQMIRDIIEEYGKLTRLYISVQNNGAFISYPWQYERAASGMFRQHHLLGVDMIAGLESTDYILGVGSLTLEDRASGTSSDFAQRNGILYSFNVNIRQDEADGVIIPENQILNAAEDVWRAITAAADNLNR